MRALILSILIFIILIFVSKKDREGFDKQKEDLMITNVIKYIQNSINSRKGASKDSQLSGEKYQKQILGLSNALKYATYIQNNIIKK
jgi:hypothetical protein